MYPPDRVVVLSTLSDKEKDKFYQFFVDEGIEVRCGVTIVWSTRCSTSERCPLGGDSGVSCVARRRSRRLHGRQER